jgi:hypothetical protein
VSNKPAPAKSDKGDKVDKAAEELDFKRRQEAAAKIADQKRKESNAKAEKADQEKMQRQRECESAQSDLRSARDDPQQRQIAERKVKALCR